MLSLLIPLSLFSAVTLHSLEPVDAQCRPWERGPLFVTYAAVGQSCAPGGPCSRMPMGDLPAGGIRVIVAGCAKPQPGQFVEAGRRCNGARLRKFTGRLPPGVDFSINAPRTSVGYLTSPGADRGFHCPGSSGPVRTVTHQLEPRPLWASGWEVHVPMQRFTWKPDGPDHFRLLWEDTGGWAVDRPLAARVEGRTPELALANAQRDDQARIRVRGEVQVTETLTGRKGDRCKATWAWTLRFSVPGTAIEMTGTGRSTTPQIKEDCQLLEAAPK